MKTIFLKIPVALALIVNVISCKAQVQPLNTKLKDIIPNAYLKDLNNELAPFIGEYISTYQDKTILLHINKENQKLIYSSTKTFYQDVLSIRYIVKNSTGTVLQDTQSMNFSSNQKLFTIYSLGTRPNHNSVMFYYGGTNCGIGWGQIDLKKLNATQISWEYRPNSLVIDEATCPTGTDKKVYLPVTKDLIFTKQ